MTALRSASSLLTSAVLLALCLPGAARAQSTAGETAPSAEFVITAQAKGRGPAPLLEQQNVDVWLQNKPAQITGWTPLRGSDAGMQLVFLLDESSPSYLALQFPSMRRFIESLPGSAEVAIAYMSNGRAVFQTSLTSDHAAAAKSLRLPNTILGITGSPYFCLSDLAKKWPSQAKTRRVVFMITNGEDPYYRTQDLQDPYVQAAIRDSQKANLLVYSIYFRNVGSRGFGSMGVLFGQSYLLMVSRGTGGQAYTEAMTTPVSFDPFLKQFRTALDNQYRATVAASGSGLQRVKVKSRISNVNLVAPAQVNVGPSE